MYMRDVQQLLLICTIDEDGLLLTTMTRFLSSSHRRSPQSTLAKAVSFALSVSASVVSFCDHRWNGLNIAALAINNSIDQGVHESLARQIGISNYASVTIQH